MDLVVLLDMGQLRIIIVKFKFGFIIKRTTTEFLAVLFSVDDCIFRGGGRF